MSLSRPVSIYGCHRLFQAKEEDPVLRGSSFAHPSTSDEPVDRKLGQVQRLRRLDLLRLVVWVA